MKLLNHLKQAVLAFILLSPAPFAAELNQKAPDFKAMDSNGKEHSLSDYAGKIVVLEWKNHQCPFVVKHYSAGNMQGLQKYAKENDIVWLSVVSSAPGKQGYLADSDANAQAKSEGSHAHAVLQDVTGALGKLYDAKVTPHMFIIDKNGVLVYDGAIDDKRSAKSEDIATSRNYVRENLQLLLEGKPVSEQKTNAYGCSVKY